MKKKREAKPRKLFRVLPIQGEEWVIASGRFLSLKPWVPPEPG